MKIQCKAPFDYHLPAAEFNDWSPACWKTTTFELETELKFFEYISRAESSSSQYHHILFLFSTLQLSLTGVMLFQEALEFRYHPAEKE